MGCDHDLTPAYETLRALVEERHCDPMQPTTGTKSSRRVGPGQTALHLYNGPLEPFQYLLKQEFFEVDLTVKNARGRDMKSAHLRALGRSTNAIAVFLMKYRDQLTVQGYPKKSKTVRLHFAAGTFLAEQFLLQLKPMLHYEMIAPTISRMLKEGVDVHCRNGCGFTPLQAILFEAWYTKDLSQIILA